jgi:hypothetical protein
MFGMGYDKKSLPIDISALAISADGQAYIVGGSCGSAYLRYMVRDDFLGYSYDQSPVTAIAIGRWIAIAYEGDYIGVVDSFMNHLCGFRAYQSRIRMMAMDRKLLATADQRTVKVWDLSKVCDLSNGSCTYFLEFKDDISALAVSDAASLLFIGVANDIIVWDMHNNRVLHKLQKHRGLIQSLVFKNSVLWSAARDGYLRCWNMANGKCIKRVQLLCGLKAMDVASDGRTIIVAYQQVGAVAYDVVAERTVDFISWPREGDKPCEGDKFVIGGNRIVMSCSNGSVLSRKIADYKFSIYVENELSGKIENITILDRSKAQCSKPVTCEAGNWVRLEGCSRFSLESNYELNFSYFGKQFALSFDEDLEEQKNFLFTRCIKSGQIWLVMGALLDRGTKDEKYCFSSYPIPAMAQYEPDDTEVNLHVYSLGKEIKQLILRDAQEGQGVAQKDEVLSFLWNIKMAKAVAPYSLGVETDDGMKYSCKIPFIGPQTDLMLSLLVKRELEKKAEEPAEQGIPEDPLPEPRLPFTVPQLVLYREVPSQQHYIPLEQDPAPASGVK